MSRILLIDDESNIRRMLRLALEHVGHTVGQAADGEEGLGRFGDGTEWDLVLLDQRMPDMEGLEVLRELRRRRPGVRVIMITAFGTIDLATEALHTGATDFLRKPFAIDVLRRAVTEALEDRPHLPQVANAVPQPVLSFDNVGINGFRLATLPGIEHADGGALHKRFSVQRSEGAGRSCTVVLPPRLIEQVLPLLAGSPLPGGDGFWEALCGEALANYLWQNASLPPGGTLVVEELTRGLERWIDALVEQAKAA